jgi:hypothetical protein
MAVAILASNFAPTNYAGRRRMRQRVEQQKKQRRETGIPPGSLVA